jgi:hypothetical protein
VAELAKFTDQLPCPRFFLHAQTDSSSQWKGIADVSAPNQERFPLKWLHPEIESGSGILFTSIAVTPTLTLPCRFQTQSITQMTAPQKISEKYASCGRGAWNPSSCQIGGRGRSGRPEAAVAELRACGRWRAVAEVPRVEIRVWRISCGR